MALSNIEILNGILLIIYCGISITVGVRIILKYFKNKEINYLYAGLTWIFLVWPWFPAIISFIMILLGGGGLSSPMYSLIGNLLIPIGLILWIIFFSELIYKDKQIIMVSLTVIYSIIFYIFLFYFLFTDPIVLGEVKGNIDFEVGFWVTIFYITILVILLVTGIVFAVASLKFDSPEYKLRGKLLLFAYIFYILGSAIDALIPQDFLILIISRSFQIIGAFLFYLAFHMPNWLKKRIV